MNAWPLLTATSNGRNWIAGDPNTRSIDQLQGGVNRVDEMGDKEKRLDVCCGDVDE